MTAYEHGFPEAASVGTPDGLTVGQVAERFGVTVRTLHHYDEIGLLRPSERTRAGYRVYTADDIVRLRTIVLYRRCLLSTSPSPRDRTSYRMPASGCQKETGTTGIPMFARWAAIPPPIVPAPTIPTLSIRKLMGNFSCVGLEVR